MRRKTAILVSIILLLVTLVLVAGAVWLKSAGAGRKACSSLEKSLRQLLGGPVRLGSCVLDLLPPVLEVDSVEVLGSGGAPKATIEHVLVELDAWSLLTGSLRVERLLLVRPEIRLTREGGQWLDWKLAFADPSAPGGDWSLGQWEVREGAVDLAWESQALLQLRGVDLQGYGIPLDRSWRLALRVSGGRLDWADAKAPGFVLNQVALTVRGDAQHWELTQAVVQVGPFDLKADGRGERFPTQGVGDFLGSLRWTLRFPLEELSNWLSGISDLRGQCLVGGSIHRDAQGWQVTEGFLQANDVQLGITGLSDWQLKFQGDPNQITFSEINVTTPAGLLHGQATLGLVTPFALSGELAVNATRLRDWIDWVGGSASGFDFEAAGRVRFQGQGIGKNGPFLWATSEWELVPGSLTLAGAPDWKLTGPAKLMFRAALTPRRVRFPEVRFEIGQSQLQAEGRIRFAERDIDLQIHSQPLFLRDFLGSGWLPWDGEGRLSLAIIGPLDEPRLVTQVDLDDLRWEGRSLGAVQLKGSRSAERWVVDSFLMSGRSGRLEGSGDLSRNATQELHAELTLREMHLSQLSHVLPWQALGLPLDGLVTGRLQASGTRTAPVVTVGLGFSQVTVGQQRMEEGLLVGRWEGGWLQLEAFEARLGSGWLYARGRVSPEAGCDLSMYTTGLRASSLQFLRSWLGELDARLDLNLTLKGSLHSPALEGWIKAYDTRLAGRELGSSFLSAQADSECVRFRGNILGDLVQVSGELALSDELPFSLQLRFGTDSGESIVDDLGWGGSSGGSSKLRFQAGLDLEGRLRRWSSLVGRLQIDSLSWDNPWFSVATDGLATARLQADSLTWERLQLLGPDTQLAVGGSLSLSTGPNLSLQGSTNLALLPTFLDLFSLAVGTAQVEMTLQGSWQKPRLYGTARISAEMLRMTDIPVDMHQVTGQLTGSAAGLEFVGLRGTAGGGSFLFQGRVPWDGLRPAGVAFNLDVDSVRYEVFEGLWGICSGGLRLRRTGDNPVEVSGDLLVHKGAFQEHMNLIAFNQRFFRPQIAVARAQRRPTALLDLRLQFADAFQVGVNLDQFDVSTRMRGFVRVVGSNERVGLLGEMDATDGEMHYLTKEFEVRSARVLFEDAFSTRPRLDVLAQRTESVDRGQEGETSYLIELRLTGEGDDPRVTLHSEPVLDERDIVTLLSLGVTSRDVATLKGENLVGLGGEILSRSLNLNERLSQIFPFPPEVIQPKYLRLRSRFSLKTTSTSPHVETGLRLRFISDKLDLDYSRSLLDYADQSLDLTYRLAENIFGRLRWQDTPDANVTNIGDLGLDLRFQWEW